MSLSPPLSLSLSDTVVNVFLLPELEEVGLSVTSLRSLAHVHAASVQFCVRAAVLVRLNVPALNAENRGLLTFLCVE